MAPSMFEGVLGLGYNQDLPDIRDFISHDVNIDGVVREGLYGAAPQGFVPASMMQYRKGSLYQGGASSCVAHAIARAIDMSLRAELEGLGIVIEPPMASRRKIYFDARQQENVDAIRVGQPIPTMTDRGCFPRFGMRGVQNLGFCDETFFPYTDDSKKINEPPPPAAYKQAFDQKGFRYSRPVLNPIIECARGLAMKRPFLFGMFVDTAFMNNRGAIIESVDTNDKNGGGHMLCGLEITNSEVVFDNWWCPPGNPSAWGSLGIGRMTHKLFASSVVTDRYILETAPIFSSM